ncbi:tyrosine-type recombinase/integrase [Planctomyces sp. SH-PL14]|uniref:tyrosine-type recombinase/integrase n=1 Tax=Planctomyces sp. SH-PL14 TaxID=1632864 RepID=UPI0018D299A9|nr:site-specific integrase [Planctomyces sp. SH-PL14]
MDPKPWFRAHDGWWYVQVRTDGARRQVKLVKGQENEAEAVRRWHQLMLTGDSPQSIADAARAMSLIGLVDVFLDYVKRELSPATFDYYELFLSSFCRTIDRRMQIPALKPFHVTAWLAKKTGWNTSTKHNGVRAVKRALKWAMEEGYIETSPIAHMKAPPKLRRETIITPEQFQLILSVSRDQCFKDLLLFLWHTGVRPQEAAKIERRHVDPNLRRIVFPPSEAKGKKAPRVIYLSDPAFEIVSQHMVTRKGHPVEGAIFKNVMRRPWNKDSLNCRFRRIKQKTGISVCAYHFRHSFATNALQNLDPITVSVLMGHSDATTLARTYQHLAKKPEYLQKAAQQAITSQPNVLETDGRNNG